MKTSNYLAQLPKSARLHGDAPDLAETVKKFETEIEPEVDP